MVVNPPDNPYKSYEVQTKTLQRAFESVVKQNERTVQSMQKGLAGDYAKMLRQLKEILGDAHSSFAQHGKLSYQELVRYDRIKKLEERVSQSIKDGYAPIKKRVISDQKRIIEDTYKGTAEAVVSAASLSIKTPQLTGDQINAILAKPWSGVTMQERMALRVTDLGVRLNGALKRGVMGEGITYSESMKTLKELVTKDYAKTKRVIEDAAHQYQSDTTNTALNDMAEKDLEIISTWVTAGDDNVRSAHRLLDGQTILAGEMFEIPSGEFAGYKSAGPSLFGVMELDAGCRCYQIAGVRMKGEEE